MTTANGAPVTNGQRRQLVRGKPLGVPYEPWQYTRLFTAYAGGTVLDTDFDVRQIEDLITSDGSSKKAYEVLTLPIRSATWQITNAPGDAGEGDLCRQVMSTLMGGLIDRCTNAFATRKTFHELVWELSDGKVVLSDIAYRPTAACRQAWTPAGDPDGFWQQVPSDYTLTAGRIAGASPSAQSPKWPGWVRIDAPRSYVHIHGKHRQPITGTSDLEVALSLYGQRKKLTFLLYQFLELQSVPRVVAYGENEGVADRRADALFEAKAGGIVPVDLQGQSDATSKTYEVIESSGQGVDQFLQTIRWLESQASQSILAGFTDLTDQAASGKGSYALSASQSEFFLESRQAVADELAASITEGVLKPLSVLNFGADAAVPTMTIGPLSDRHLERAYELMKDLLTSPVINGPDAIVDTLLISTAQYLGQSVDDVRKMVEDHQAEREAQQAAARLDAQEGAGKQQGADGPSPQQQGRPATARQQQGEQQAQQTNAADRADATALAHTIDATYDAVAAARAGVDPTDLTRPATATRRRRNRNARRRGDT